MRMTIHEYWVSLDLLEFIWVFMSPWISLGLCGSPSLMALESLSVPLSLIEFITVSLGHLGSLGLLGTPSLLTQEFLLVSCLFGSLWVSLGLSVSFGLFGCPWVSLV